MPNKQWHPVFVTALKEALSDAGPGEIEIQAEVALSSKPLDVDVIVVKKKETARLRHPVANIFRQYNLFEYKSPQDYLEPNDYDKGMALTLLYKVIEHPGMELLNRLTLTFVSSRYPRDMLKMLESRGLTVLKDVPVSGFYRVEGERIPVQIMVLKHLPGPEQAYMFSVFLSGKEKLKQNAGSMLLRKHLEEPGNANIKEIIEFMLKNNLILYNDIKVVLEMKSLISAEERKKVRELLATHPFNRELMAEQAAEEAAKIAAKIVAEASAKAAAKAAAEAEAKAVARATAEGRAEGVRNIICRFLEAKYGAASAQLQETIQKIIDPDVLDEIAGKLFVASSLEEMQKIINGD